MAPVALYFDILQYQAANLKLLNAHFDLVVFNNPSVVPDDVLARVELVFAPLGFVFDDQFFDKCPKLTVVASNTTGIPHIYAESAKRRGITVCALHDEGEFLEDITPTAEHTIGLILAASRRLPAAHQAAVEGRWDRRPWGAPRMMSKLTLGVVGFGRLGQKVAKISAAMGMKTAFYDPYQPGGESSLIDLAEKSDVLSIHAKVTPETRGMVNRKILSALPKQAIVVNTARGEILDLDALLDLLESRHLWAAALDTIDGEFEADFGCGFGDSRVVRYARQHDNLVLTPHIGGSTVDAWFATERRVIEKACRRFCVEE